MRFKIDLKVKSWNDIACKHWIIYKEAAEEVRYATMQAIANYRIKPMSTPVSIHFHAQWKGNKRRDIDALYLKPVLDQLVTQGILPDDNWSVVRSVTYSGETGMKKDELLVSIHGAVDNALKS